MAQNFKDNTLYEMDNLVVLRGMNSETVDLIATDPPFNTSRSRAGTAGFYVDNWKWGDTGILPDQWKWNEVHPQWLEEIKDEHLELYQVIESTKVVHGEDTAAFLCFLSVRLLEMHRVLKPTGSIYLHCDHTANSYIRMAMDAIFGKKNFRNEIVWRKYGGHKNTAKLKFTTENDTLLFYSVSNTYTFNQIFRPLSEQTIKSEYKHVDENGRRYSIPRGRKYRQGVVKRVYLDTHPGVAVGNLWTEKELTMQGRDDERTGSPDQKPLALYERIIEASSNEGDIVLDPFCGCATTIIAANNLKRRWIGVDRRKDARYHIITRLMGISREKRERLEQYALNQEWLEGQMQRYEIHYQTESPTRTDNGEQELAELPQVYVAEPENLLTHAEMHEILVNQFGLQCWGCHYQPPDKRYLHLDHIIPKSEGGSNHIDNRALLCQPCNSMKSNTMSLTALRRRNRQEEYEKDNEPIDLPTALAWTRQHMIDLIRRSPHQYEINF